VYITCFLYALGTLIMVFTYYNMTMTSNEINVSECYGFSESNFQVFVNQTQFSVGYNDSETSFVNSTPTFFMKVNKFDVNGSISSTGEFPFVSQ
jgi:hypothetical protein